MKIEINSVVGQRVFAVYIKLASKISAIQISWKLSPFIKSQGFYFKRNLLTKASSCFMVMALPLNYLNLVANSICPCDGISVARGPHSAPVNHNNSTVAYEGLLCMRTHLTHITSKVQFTTEGYSAKLL